MEQLQARQLEVELRLAQLSREARDARRSQRRNMTVPPVMWRIATVIGVLTHPRLEPPCLYLLQKRNRLEPMKDELRTRLADWYSSHVTPATRTEILHPSTKEGKLALIAASHFVNEMKLHAWVEDVNISNGIAPRTSVVLNKSASIAPVALTTGPSAAPKGRKHQLQWLRRWRRRWGVKLASLAARDTLPSETCQRKVRRIIMLLSNS